MEEWFLIANPVAGGRKWKELMPEIISLLDKHKISCNKTLSERKEHAISLARDAVSRGYVRFISIGGDGTANEIVNGIMSCPGINSLDFTLAVIPVGTGNDWGRSVGIPPDYKTAIEAVAKGKHIIQDICRVNFRSVDGNMTEKHFVNVAGAGYDAEVLFKTERMKEKGRRGSWLYFYNILTSLFSYKPRLTTIKIDGEELIKEKSLSINIGIGKYNGGGLMQVPHAVLDDGKIAFTFIGDIGKIGIILNLHKLKSGKIEDINKVKLLKGKKIEIVSEPGMLFEADGEALGETPLTFEIVPKALKVIIH